MNRIEGINSYSQLGPIGAASTGGADQPGKAAPSGGAEDDQVEISSVARYLSLISGMPEIRAEKVEAIRQALADGSYDLEGKIPPAVEQLLNEHPLE